MTLVAVIADTHLPRGARRLPDCVSRLERADLNLHAGDPTAVLRVEGGGIEPEVVKV